MGFTMSGALASKTVSHHHLIIKKPSTSIHWISMQSRGVQPDYVMRHSVENTLATVAGVMKLGSHRGQLMQSLPQGGGRSYERM